MNRRSFLSSLAALPAAVAVAPIIAAQRATPVVEYAMNTTGLPTIARADGRRFIVGIATETVRAGDFVQIQTYGPAQIKVRGSDVSNGLNARRTGLTV